MPSHTSPLSAMRRDASRARPRQQFAAARAFYLTILVISAFAAWSVVAPRRGLRSASAGSQLLKRTELVASDGALHTTSGSLVRRDEECWHVHTAENQCAFVRANCPDEEAGLISYLQLYYCKLHTAKPVAFIILVLWLGLLFSTIGIAASDFFCINLSTIASILGMSESMAGVTFLAFGNGSPDVFSTFAAMKSHSGSLAVGELIGAAGFITSVVAGSMALVRPFKVARKSFVRDVMFFIVAASFSMVFLADGHLHLWECAVMVGFYLFYVITVVVWHWYLRRRLRRRIQEDAARSHFFVPGNDEAEVEPYHDDDEESAQIASGGPSRTVSADDFANLERAGSPMLRPMDEEVDADDETRDRYLAEISSNMRVSRPKRGERRNTINPIRPSLVGALEFRAVLSSLQKSRNIQTYPINLRRYSDDATFTTAQQQDQPATASNPEINLDVDAHDVASNFNLRATMDAEHAGPNRIRAVSANDAVGLRLDPSALQGPRVPKVDLEGATPPGSARLQPPVDNVPITGPIATSSQSPDRHLPPPASEYGYLASSPASMAPLERKRSGDLLAPPGDGFPGLHYHHSPRSGAHKGVASPPTGSVDEAAKPRVPRIHIPRSAGSSGRSSPLSPFPAYYDDPDFVPSSSRTPSIRLPPPSIGSESTFHQHFYQDPEEKPLRWWPYRVLPTPEVLFSTLFPTLYSWKDKNIWEKMLGIVAAPSVFLLAITLPIVEVEKDKEDSADVVDPDPGLLNPDPLRPRSGSTTLATLPPDSPPQAAIDDAETEPPNVVKHGNHGLSSPAINITPSPDQVPARPELPYSKSSHRPSAPPDTTKPPPSSPKDWNRWLVSTQLFTGPLFIVLLIWANTNPHPPFALLLPTFSTLLASLIAFALLLLFTSPSTAPKYHHLLCYLGFIVSIAWISTIANEVVGVLKALGIILNISDAILGLTIFAVGNSLGDLVADITVARLGYPVMALSACFGGPMLNILLGIGISGLYMTIHGGEQRHEKHPGRPLRYKPYQIEVGGTLLISAVTLLVTLLGLLVVVPARGWWMDRKVGWGLVVLWTLSTIGNVVVEVLGWGAGKES